MLTLAISLHLTVCSVEQVIVVSGNSQGSLQIGSEVRMDRTGVGFVKEGKQCQKVWGVELAKGDSGTPVETLAVRKSLKDDVLRPSVG